MRWVTSTLASRVEHIRGFHARRAPAEHLSRDLPVDSSWSYEVTTPSGSATVDSPHSHSDMTW